MCAHNLGEKTQLRGELAIYLYQHKCVRENSPEHAAQFPSYEQDQLRYANKGCERKYIEYIEYI